MQKNIDNKYYMRYSKRSDISSLASNYNNGNSLIGEFSITNKEGSHYVYALPVYSKNEINKSLSVKPDDTDDNYIAYKDISDESEESDIHRISGQKIDDEYASTFLLTEITSTNYIDRTLDGPSNDDFGGWTKFNYTKVHDNYHWRSPWKGLSYSPAELSRDDDDMGSYASGDKEIYYLQSVETASHTAEFTIENRNDALEATDDINAANNNITLTELKKLKKLTKIILYAKKADGSKGEIVKTVYFYYDYSLCQGIANSVNGGGKLTLTNVRFEYGEKGGTV